MAFIESLNLQVWILQVFAGTPEIFAIVSLLVIASMAAMFRMNTLGMFLIIGIFLIIFSEFIVGFSMLTMTLIMGGLVLGYFIAKMITE